MRLEGKITLITGASSGIGRACALRFAHEGATLVLVDVNAAAADALVGEIRRVGGAATFVHADIGRREENDRAIDECVRLHGRIDILVCNAGVTLPKLVTESSDDEIERVFAVNLLGPIYATRRAIPLMLAHGGGTILINASKTGLVAQADSPVYCATKGGAVMFAKALAIDYATRGIRVNALCPGVIDTPMLREFANAMPDPDAAWSRYAASQPMGRLGTADECAEAALWLVSDESSFVTGVALPVDGGFTAM
jgi:meso-butanediol dehydrogenase/(S,S)-butanediol dehydrogenase/diacetyl reductase